MPASWSVMTDAPNSAACKHLPPMLSVGEPIYCLLRCLLAGNCSHIDLLTGAASAAGPRRATCPFPGLIVAIAGQDRHGMSVLPPAHSDFGGNVVGEVERRKQAAEQMINLNCQ